MSPCPVADGNFDHLVSVASAWLLHCWKKSVFAVKPQSLQVEGKLERENHHLVDPIGTSPVAQMVTSVPAEQET